MILPRCIICGGSLSICSLPGLLQCRKCGFITADREVSDMELKKLYNRAYFNGEEYANYLKDKMVIQKNFEDRLCVIRNEYGKLTGLKIFEIGCAYGFFLYVADNAGACACGIDIAEEAVNYAVKRLGVNAVCKEYLAYEIQEAVDIICMWDTIEHLNYPEQYIKKCWGHLKKGGLLCITTGDIGSFNARVRGKRWRQIHPPTHLHYFSKKTLCLLLKRKGFIIKKVCYPSMVMSMNTIAYKIIYKQLRQHKIYDFLKKTGILKLNIKINLHDLMFILAEKG